MTVTKASYILIILQLWKIASVNGMDLKELSDNSCVGPIQITAEKPQIPIDEWETEHFQIIKAPEEIEVTAVRIRRKTRYCADAFTKMFGAGCDRNDVFVELTKSDMTNAMEGFCTVGNTCTEDTCAGTRAIECESNIRDITVKPGPLNWVGGELKMVRYSCVQKWSCEIKRYVAAPHSTVDGSNFKVLGLSGDDLNLSDFQKGDQGWHYGMSNWEIFSGVIETQCIGSKQNKLCRYKTNPPEYMLMSNGKGRDRNTILRKDNISASGSDGWGDLSGPTTVDELKHALTKTIFNDLKNTHNILHIMGKLSSVQRQIISLISGDKKGALADALGRDHVAVQTLGPGYVICPYKEKNNNSSGNLDKLNVMEYHDLILEYISSKPVIDESIKSEIYEAALIKESYHSGGKSEEAKISSIPSFSLTWFTKEVLFYTGSICGIVALIRR